MVSDRSAWWARGETAVLCLASLALFVPDTLALARLGVPDILFTGDGAALELGTFHAANGTQAVGPYSRFGWNHPGPAFFYLAAPVYEWFDRRGPALNVVALLVNAAAVTAIVLSAKQLRGFTFAACVAALLAALGLVGLPFLLANEWNPILPILPLALSCFLAMRVSVGAWGLPPMFALVASAIVQTHVGFAPAVFALCVFLYVATRTRRRDHPTVNSPGRYPSWTMAATMAALLVLWALPLYEVIAAPPGNLTRVVGFFLLRTSWSHPWTEVLRTVADQMAVMPWAVVQAVAQRPLPPPGTVLAAAIAVAELVTLTLFIAGSRRSGDGVLRMLSGVALGGVAVGIVAVQSIRGEILPYLVAWVALTGFLFLVAMVAWALPTIENAIGTASGSAVAIACAVALGGLAVAGPVPRSGVVRQPDLEVEELARNVESYLRRDSMPPPTVRIVSRDSWPTAVAIVLHLTKRGVPVFVEEEWLNVVGKQFAEAPGMHPALLFGDRTLADSARSRTDVTLVAEGARVSVLWAPVDRP